MLSKPKYSIASDHLTTRNLWNTVNWECLAVFLCSYMLLGILILEDIEGCCDIWYLIWVLLFDDWKYWTRKQIIYTIIPAFPDSSALWKILSHLTASGPLLPTCWTYTLVLPSPEQCLSLSEEYALWAEKCCNT